MSVWILEVKEGYVTLLHEDRSTGAISLCGVNPAERVQEVIEWAAAESEPGDAIMYGGRLLLSKMLPGVC